jgi:hypothetical protein
MLDFSPHGSFQSGKMGREAKISAASADDGSEISLKREAGIRETTDVEVKHSDYSGVGRV